MHYTVERLKWPMDPNQYEKIYQFLLRCADRGYNEHFHWARFEWMMHHTYLDTENLSAVALFMDDKGEMRGLCTYDTSWGEGAYIVHDTDDEELLHRMVEFGGKYYFRQIIPNKKDAALIRVLEKCRWQEDWAGNHVLQMDLSQLPDAPVAEGFTLSAPDHVLDRLQYQTVIHQGFEDDSEMVPWPDSVFDPPPPHFDTALKVFAIRDGKYCAHAGVWYTSGETCYVEPVATLPECRRKGLARACLVEGMRRAKEMGAKRAIVLSGDPFYRSTGFVESSFYQDWERIRD
ncbi:MAG: GNAT family N-acetyltransferase [Clostridia bacterium]|nr:GNAT family N-acetyltransferase [Clostridia bacterium]